MFKRSSEEKSNIPYQKLEEEKDFLEKSKKSSFLDLFNRNKGDKEEKAKFYVEWKKEQEKEGHKK